MAVRKTRTQRQQLLSRTAEVTAVRVSFRLGVDEPKTADPQIEGRPWLEIFGTLEEPVADQFDIEFNLYPRDDVRVGSARPASVGAITQVKPHISVVASMPPAEFDRLWLFAMSGQLKYAWLSLTKPHYGSALVPSLSFSTVKEE